MSNEPFISLNWLFASKKNDRIDITVLKICKSSISSYNLPNDIIQNIAIRFDFQ